MLPCTQDEYDRAQDALAVGLDKAICGATSVGSSCAVTISSVVAYVGSSQSAHTEHNEGDVGRRRRRCVAWLRIR